ncbi:MAG: T9SS C-terminal target domain-containing protein [Calditrichaeota bacterium]|nr:MAG: T9SS C-terminal target domain-containing protein [Calditrichota bacterium]
MLLQTARQSLVCFFLLFVSISFSFADTPIVPEPVIVEQTDFDLSESQTTPNLYVENNQLYLCFQTKNNEGRNIKILQLDTEPQFFTTFEDFCFDSTENPYHPLAKSFGSSKLLFWQTEDVRRADTSFQQKVVTYDNIIPSSYDFTEIAQFNNYPEADIFHPQFEKTEQRIYCEFYSSQSNDQSNNRYELSLRSFDAEEATTYPTNLHFSANGRTALAPYGDSLLLIKSWIVCTQTEFPNCVEWATGYKAYVIYENKISNIYALKSFDVNSKEDQPTDVYRAKFAEGDIYALASSRELITINYNQMRFEPLVHLSAYVSENVNRFIPIQTIDHNMIIVENESLSDQTLIRFDREWNFVDSTLLPFEGDVSEISEFTYCPEKDMLCYAYSTNLFENDPVKRIMLQSVIFNRDLILNPPPLLPESFVVNQNYPNPFNPTTNIQYAIPQNGNVSVDVYNIIGQKVTTLYNDYQDAGDHEIEWDASAQASGIYLIRVQYEEQTKSVKSMLVK